LAEVREIYLRSRVNHELYVAIREKSARMVEEVRYLQEGYLPDDVEWNRYAASVAELSETCNATMSAIAEGAIAAWDTLPGLREELTRLHGLLPLRLPSGPHGPGRFGAMYTRLKYGLDWDEEWRVADDPDVVVQFDDAASRLVFWRGANYIPCWVNDAGAWYTNEFVERRGWHSPNTRGCVEPMSDKQCRFSHVRIIESSDARVVVHWRYAPIDTGYQPPFIDPVTGWGDWVDEYYTVYPDAFGVRKITAHSSRPDMWMEFQESILVNHPGTLPEDSIELDAVSFANMDGETRTYRWPDDGGPEFGAPARANIQQINKYKPYAFVAPPEGDGQLMTPYKGYDTPSRFNVFGHWPVPRDRSRDKDGRPTRRPSHSSLSHIGLAEVATAEWEPYEQGETWVTKIMVNGLTDKPIADLVPLAKSWLYPPELTLTSSAYSSEGYDPTQAAYVLVAKNPNQASEVTFELAAERESPLINPGIVVKNWGTRDAVLTLNGILLIEGEDFRVGYRQRFRTSDLILWVRTESTAPVHVTVSPAAA